jgi:hypothetical protein
VGWVTEVDEIQAFYERKRPPEIAWEKAASAIAEGEPMDGYFTLPWWSTERWTDGGLWGAQHNARRLERLARARPAGVSDEGEPWHVGILYPGLPDEYLPQPVGVVTRQGHVGCLPPAASTGGIDTLIRTEGHGFSYFCVPVFVDGHDARVRLPFGPDVSVFDDPWAAAGPGAGEDRVPEPWRINRSHVMAILLAEHGLTPAWTKLAHDLSRLTEEHGVTVLEPLWLEPGSHVVNDVRGDAGADFVDEICSLISVATGPAVTAGTRAVVTRYLHSNSRACQNAREAGIPIYRADGFGGRVAEALRIAHAA